MTRILDWKYLLMFVVTVAGVAAPVWLWRADLQSKSLQFKIKSITQVTSPNSEAVSGLEVTMNGKRLTSPHLAVIKLEHQGTRPITTPEFEVPLELRVNDGVELVQVQVVEKLPSELEPKVTTTSTSVVLQPLLLNPGDEITLSVLTSGTKPKFAAKGRIAGVSSIGLVDPETAKFGPILVAVLLLSSFFGLVVAALNMNMKSSPGFDINLRGRAGFLVWLVGLGVGAVPIIKVLEAFGYDSFWHTMLAVGGLFIPAALFAAWLNTNTRHPKDAA